MEIAIVEQKACLPADAIGSAKKPVAWESNWFCVLFAVPLGVCQGEVAGVDEFEIKNMQIRAVNAGRIAGDDATGIVLPPAFEMLERFHCHIPQQIMPETYHTEKAVVHSLPPGGGDYNIYISHYQQRSQAGTADPAAAHRGQTQESAVADALHIGIRQLDGLSVETVGLAA